MKYYYWSDTHFNHANIIKYCSRPFTSVAEMNEKMYEGTTKVPTGATIVHGGDFSMGGKGVIAASLERYLKSSEGVNHVLCFGNHDHPRNLGWLGANGYDAIYLDDGGRKVLVVHDPATVPLDANYDYVLYGHIHGHWPDAPDNWIHIGVDTIGYQPLTLDELIERHMNVKKTSQHI